MIPVLINASGGTAKAKGDKLRDEVEAAFADAGVAIDLRLVEGAEMTRAAEATTSDTVVIGGGDGTLGSAAKVLADRGATLGILPLGTRNHLAKELGIPADLPGAAKLIATGTTRAIDLGQVNDRVFVNNASIGLYPAMVEERDARDAPKWAAALPAARAALKRMRHHRLRLEPADGRKDVITPMLFVGNNRYRLDFGKVGQRASLEDGVLSVFAVSGRHRWALIGFVIRSVMGFADLESDFSAIGEAAAFRVSGRSETISVALDGEVVELAMPLEFAVRPKALTVIAPDQSGKSSAS